MEIDFDGDFENLFQERNLEGEALYFRDIAVITFVDEAYIEIMFNFSYCNEVDFSSKLRVNGLQMINPVLVLNVGLCVMVWYWMGYGCRRVILEKDIGHVSNKTENFFMNLFENVLLEYLHENKSVKLFTIENNTMENYIPKYQSVLYDKNNTYSPLAAAAIPPKILVPIGGM